MNFYSICVFSICLHFITAAPVLENEKTFYDAIIEKCPSMKSLPNYKDSSFFKTCKDWKTISEVKNLTNDNQDDIRCLLYFETFTSFCTKTEKPNITIPKAVLLNYNLKSVCDFFKTQDNENLKSVFQNVDSCPKICSDDLGYLNSVCGVSYYFAHVPEKKSDNPTQILTAPAQFLNKSDEKGNTLTNVKKTANQILSIDNASENKERGNIPVESAVNGDIPEPRNILTSDNNQPDVAETRNILTGNHQPDLATPRNILNGNNNQPGEIPLPNNSPSSVVNDATPDPQKNLAGNPQQEPPNVPVVPDNSPATDQENGQQSEKNLKPDTKNESTVVKTNVETNNAKEETGINKGEETANENQDTQQVPINPEHIPLDSEMDEDDFQENAEDDVPEPVVDPVRNEKSSKPLQTDDESDSEPVNYTTEMDGDSYFFTYFMVLCIIFIAGYVCYHNKQKILALILEGRRGKRQHRGRRPNSANYHKLDSNLEEAINSSCKKNTNNVIY